MRYRLRTLLMVLALAPPLLGACFAVFSEAPEAIYAAAFLTAFVAVGAGLITANART
jgi:hypothetical protein